MQDSLKQGHITFAKWQMSFWQLQSISEELANDGHFVTYEEGNFQLRDFRQEMTSRGERALRRYAETAVAAAKADSNTHMLDPGMEFARAESVKTLHAAAVNARLSDATTLPRFPSGTKITFGDMPSGPTPQELATEARSAAEAFRIAVVSLREQGFEVSVETSAGSVPNILKIFKLDEI